MKRVSVYFIVFYLILSLAGCSAKIDTKPAKNFVCSLDNPVASQWLIDVNKNNQILTLELKTEITKEKILEAYPQASETDIRMFYAEQKNSFISDYNYIMQTFPQIADKVWFNVNIAYDDNKLYLLSDYSFNVSHERFHYDLEDAFLNAFGLDGLYDAEKKGFFYNEEKIRQTLFGENEMICSLKGE